MPTHVIPLTHVLSPAEREALDSFAAEHRGVASLPALRAFLADRFHVDVVLDPAIVQGFAEDGSHRRGFADALGRPRDERECAAILRACSGAGIPVTVSGGRSNLTGSATPEGGMVMSTVRLTAPPVTVDLNRRRARAPVGAILEDVRQAIVTRSGGTLGFPVDPTSRGDASLGGALACNASGFTPGETGAMRAWVRRLRLMLVDGRVADAERGQYVSRDGRWILVDGAGCRDWPVPRYPRPRIKNAGGPFSSPDGRLDLVDLVVGSEGIFGLVTACELDLAPRPPAHLDLFMSLPSEAHALAVLEGVRAARRGDLSGLSAFEYFGPHSRRIMRHESRFFRGDDAVAIYIQEPVAEGNPEDAAAAWMDVLGPGGCGVREEAIRVLDSDDLRARFLEARHSVPANALEIVRRKGTQTVMTDTVVPPERFGAFLDFAHGCLAEKRLEYVVFGHLGDCHLHFMLLPDRDQITTALEAYDAIVDRSAEYGGVYSGEHGTGKRKRGDFLRCYGAEAVEQVRACKAAVDPQGLLNRGNVMAW